MKTINKYIYNNVIDYLYYLNVKKLFDVTQTYVFNSIVGITLDNVSYDLENTYNYRDYHSYYANDMKYTISGTLFPLLMNWIPKWEYLELERIYVDTL